MRDDKSRLYPHITGVRGNDGEDPSVLAVTAVLDPSEHYPDEGRIILGSPRQSDKLDGYIPNLGGFCCGVEAADALIATLQQAVSDIRQATGKKRIGVWDNPPSLVGFQRIGRVDNLGQRSLWLREGGGGFELRAGRDGDVHVAVDRTNPQFGPLYDVVSAARFAAEYEEAHGMTLFPMGIERYGFEESEEEIVDVTGHGTTVFRFSIKDCGESIGWTEPHFFRVIVRHHSHFAVQHRCLEPDLIEGCYYHWEPATQSACGVTADFVMCMLLRTWFAIVSTSETNNNVTTVNLGELRIEYQTEH